MPQTVNEHIQYLKLKGRAERTIYARHNVLRMVAGFIDPVQISEAAETDLLAWRISLHRLSRAAVVCYVSHVRGYYKWLADEGYRPDNPAARIPVPPTPEYQPRPISEQDLLLALDSAPGRIRLWVVLAGWAGLRAKEIAMLQRRNIRDRDTPPALIVTRESSKGEKRGRTVWLCPFAVAEIRDGGLPASGWCFPRRDGLPGHVSAKQLSNEANAFLHSLGIPDTFHSLRHRFATELLDTPDGDVRLVQDQLGHARLSTTQVYMKVKDSRAAAAVGALPAPRLRAAS